MSSTAENPYLHREFYPEGQDPEVGYPRDLGKNHTRMGKKISEIIFFPKDTLLCSQIHAQPSCHERGFIKQLKKTGAEPQPNIRPIAGILQKTAAPSDPVVSRAREENPQNQLTWTHG